MMTFWLVIGVVVIVLILLGASPAAASPASPPLPRRPPPDDAMIDPVVDPLIEPWAAAPHPDAPLPDNDDALHPGGGDFGSGGASGSWEDDGGDSD